MARELSRRQVLTGSLGLAAVAGGSLLAGCGGTPPTGAGAQGQGQGATGTTNAAGRSTEISYWHINTAAFGLPAVQKLVSDFQSKTSDITVQQQFQPNSYTGLLSNVQTALAAKRPPDVAQIGYLYQDYVKNNFPYISVADLVKKFGPEDFLKSLPKNVLDLGLTSDGVQIGVPYAVSNIVCYYNGDLMKSAGLSPDAPPKTWPDWRKAAETYKEKTGNHLLYVQILDDNWTTSAMIQSHGGTLTKCDGGQVKAAFDSREAAEAIQFWADLIKDGLCLNVEWTQGGQEFLAQKVGTFMTTIAKRSNLTSSASFDLRATSWPSFPGYNVSLPAGGNALVVFAQDEDKQRAAWQFIQYLLSPAGVTTWVKGTGYLPPTNNVTDDPQYLGNYFKQNPIAQVSEDQLPVTGPWSYFPGPNALQAGKQGLYQQGLQPALGGKQTAQQSLSAAAATVNGLLAGQECS